MFFVSLLSAHAYVDTSGVLVGIGTVQHIIIVLYRRYVNVREWNGRVLLRTSTCIFLASSDAVEDMLTVTKDLKFNKRLFRVQEAFLTCPPFKLNVV